MTTPIFITTPPDYNYGPGGWTSSVAATIAPTVAPGYNLIALPAADPNLYGLMIENFANGDVYLRLGITSAAALVGPPGSVNAGGRQLRFGYHTAWLNGDLANPAAFVLPSPGNAVYLGVYALGAGTLNIQRYS